jgi:hypothetical protein
MTSPILPIEGPLGPSCPAPPASDASDGVAFQSEPTAGRTLTIEVSRCEPPHEVLDRIEAAGRISRQLRESGHELRFSLEPGGRVEVVLADREGRTVRSLLASEAVEIAAGKPLS